MYDKEGSTGSTPVGNVLARLFWVDPKFPKYKGLCIYVYRGLAECLQGFIKVCTLLGFLCN